ncbi:hypothetical protein Fcan01_24252 [Folsomia candida]|uniref:Uncharacterized protein n=1 Tax=Folsomia candida TaxID=158441 RepID=A0A226D5N9_FOLCA|nr:hypothetical protein Fcan01_24252 [Folsomia candida]
MLKTPLILIFLSHLDSIFCTSEFNLNTTILLQHLDEDCHLILMHYSLHVEHFSPQIEAKNGYYIVHPPRLNTSSSRRTAFKYPLVKYGKGFLSQPQKSRILCIIAIVITRRTDFDLDSTRKRHHLRFLSDFQIGTLDHFICGGNVSSWWSADKSSSRINLGNILFIRIQIDFNFLLDTYIPESNSPFQYCIILSTFKSKTQQEKYELVWLTICIECERSRVLRVREENTILLLRSHLNFVQLLVEPTDLALYSDRKGYFNLDGFYGKKESCLNYAKGPFHLIREKKMTGRATLFFSLMCLGNFTYGEAVIYDSKGLGRRNRGNGKKTWTDYIFLDGSRKGLNYPKLFIATLTQGYAFMTCYSRNEFSFAILLKSFQPKVWIVFVLIFGTVVLLIATILRFNLGWSYLSAALFSPFLMVSTVFEKPTNLPRQLVGNLKFRVLFGVWMLLLIVLTNSYVGVNIKSISAPLEDKSVTRFEQLSMAGCTWNDIKCYVARFNNTSNYYNNIEDHNGVLISYRTKELDPTFPTFIFMRNVSMDVSVMLGRIKNSSIRSFDEDNDFILFPYSIGYGTSIDSLVSNDFYEIIKKNNLQTITVALSQINIYGKINETMRKKISLIDLLDPLHIPHYTIADLFPGKQVIRGAIDIEYDLVQCGRTVLISKDQDILWEMKYFEKYYPWIKFFKSNESILRDDSGWSIGLQYKSSIHEIFRKLNDAGIVTLLEMWTHGVTQKRENITRMVHNMIQKREKIGPVNKIALDGSLQTIFWCYAVLIFGAMLEWSIIEVKGLIRLTIMLKRIRLTILLRWIRSKWARLKVWLVLKVQGASKVKPQDKSKEEQLVVGQVNVEDKSKKNIRSKK